MYKKYYQQVSTIFTRSTAILYILSIYYFVAVVNNNGKITCYITLWIFNVWNVINPLKQQSLFYYKINSFTVNVLKYAKNLYNNATL